MVVITRSGSSAVTCYAPQFVEESPFEREAGTAAQSRRTSLRVARGQAAACGAARVRAMAAPDWAQLEAADGVRFSWCAPLAPRFATAGYPASRSARERNAPCVHDAQ